MKMLRVLVALVAAALLSPAFSQWQTPQYSVPIGRGGGNVGFDNVAAGTSGYPFVANGPAAKPSYQPLPINGPGISGLATGVAAFLGTPSSANLSSAVLDKTGTGVLVFSNSPALTGVPTAPTAPNGTNTTQIATTAYVQNTVTPCTVLGGFLVGTGSGVQCSTVAGAVANLNGTLSINPTAGTTNRGFNITQTGAGTAAGPIAFNYINIPSDQTNPTGATLSIAQRILYEFGGGNTQGARAGIYVESVLTSPTNIANGDRDYVGGSFFAEAQSGDNGTDTGAGARGAIFGINPLASAGPAATNLLVVTGGEVDAGIATGGSSRYRWGFNMVSSGNVQGTANDSAFALGTVSTIGWKNALYMGDQNGGAPLSTDGCVICEDASFHTIATGIDLSGFVISGNAFASPNFRVTGVGVITNNSYFNPNDGSSSGFFGVTSSFLTHSVGFGSLNNVPIAFLQNNRLAGSIDTSAVWNIGLTGTLTGQMKFSGATSGGATITAQSAAGTPTLTLPNTGGTLVATAASPLSVNATTGQVSCPTCTTSAASLTANQLVIGSGLQGAQSLGSLGTATTVLHGNASGAPSFSAVSLTADVTGNLPVANLNSGTGAGATTFWRGDATWASALTSLTPGNGLTSTLTATAPGSAVTTSGTLSAAQPVNAQTGTTYAIADGDRAKMVTASNAAAQAYSIAQAGAASAFQAGWFVDIQNLSTNVNGIVTVTPTTSTINGASSYKIQPGQTARIVSDGANYQVQAISGNQLPGTATNDAANAGNVGEFSSSQTLATSLTTGTAANAASASLTAGDWDVSCTIKFNAAATTTLSSMVVSISATSGTLDLTVGRAHEDSFFANAPTAAFSPAIHSPVVRASLSATTTYYCVAFANFGTSTLTVDGFIRARRVR